MTNKAYFKRYGKIYGVSYKYAFGRWSGYIKEFSSLETAEKWLNTDEGNFRTRELGSFAHCKSCIDAD